MIESINPSTGKRIAVYRVSPKQVIDNIINNVHGAFGFWGQAGFFKRRQVLKRVAKILRDRREKYAQLMTEEMGKPIKQSRSEIDKCVLVCDYFAENAQKFLSSQAVQTDAKKSYVAFKPLGVILAVMPWNFPFWQVFRFLAPTLMAGNTSVLKHSSNVTGCALAIEKIIQDASENADIFRVLIVESKTVSAVIEHPFVKAVTLTGSRQAGQAVASKAGFMLKKTVLELGGSDPYIILEDADLKQAVTTCVNSKLINGGQSCVAAKRFIVVESISKKFEEMFVAQMRSKKIGDPLSLDTDIGPMARFDLRDELHQQVHQCVKQGAKLLCGGKVPHMPGAFYPPTVLGNVKKGMLAYHEELFGPVASIIPVKNEDEAIKVANDNPYGLGAAVFSKDEKHAEMITRDKIEAGNCFVNSFVRSDPNLPFGGVKESGYGRELSSFGIHEFVNIKTIYVGEV